MKRFVIATASALFLIAGTATASVPSGPASAVRHVSESAVLRPRRRPGAGDRPPRPGSPPSSEGSTRPFLGRIPISPSRACPASVTPLFGAVDPALAALAGASRSRRRPAPAPVAGAPARRRPPARCPPRSRPGVTPAPAPPAESKASPPGPQEGVGQPACRRGPSRPRRRPDLFKGLPANGPRRLRHGQRHPPRRCCRSGTQRLANLDAAFSGATFSSAPIPEVKNEMARIVAPALAAGNAFGRGSGLEVGVAIDQSGQNQIIPGSVAEAKAPPSTGLVTKEVGPVNAAPLRQRQPPAGPGPEQGQRRLHHRHRPVLRPRLRRQPRPRRIAVEPGAVDRGGHARPGRVAVPVAHLPGSPGRRRRRPIRKFGLASETRQTIAPVTFFKGTAAAVHPGVRR